MVKTREVVVIQIGFHFWLVLPHNPATSETHPGMNVATVPSLMAIAFPLAGLLSFFASATGNHCPLATSDKGAVADLLRMSALGALHFKISDGQLRSTLQTAGATGLAGDSGKGFHDAGATPPSGNFTHFRFGLDEL